MLEAAAVMELVLELAAGEMKKLSSPTRKWPDLKHRREIDRATRLDRRANVQTGGRNVGQTDGRTDATDGCRDIRPKNKHVCFSCLIRKSGREKGGDEKLLR